MSQNYPINDSEQDKWYFMLILECFNLIKIFIKKAIFYYFQNPPMSATIDSILSTLRGRRQMDFVRRSRTCTAGEGVKLKSVINV